MTEDTDLIANEARDLTADRAAAGAKTFGRKDEVQALARLLAHGKSAVLVGPPGVGKTAILQKLLAYLTESRLPELAHAKVYEISTVVLCSGTRYTGQQEQRIRAVLAHAKPDRIHYVTDVWNLPYAGSYSTKPRGIYDLMRPGIEAGKLVLVGECTPGRWDKLVSDYPELGRDFVALTIKEPTEDETRDVMLRVAAELSVSFEKPAIDRAYTF